ncbi:MAG: hypothetical protein G8345_16080 [Magnetococcales bacterium]|nr:hypothetical protein [Magnetococcales bacterium]
MKLRENARIAILGGGPAGSMSGFFLKELAARINLKLTVNIFEPRDFSRTGPPGCNMCAGVVSEELVQTLAAEGINLPEMVVQRGIDTYFLHTSGLEPVDIAIPDVGMRIATVYRGGGPRLSPEGVQWSSFDGFLLELAKSKGVNHIPQRVTGLSWHKDRPRVSCKGHADEDYDLVIGAMGVNSASLKLFEELGFSYQAPPVSKGYLSEIYLGVEKTRKYFGMGSMHIFLLEIPGLKFAALIPKTENITVCLLGEDINREIVQQFFAAPEVRACFPPDWDGIGDVCRCMPKLNLGLAQNPYGNRVVMVGDCAISRLYKDGIGAAYITAKAAAVTAVFLGVHRDDFHNYYRPVVQRMDRDNHVGEMIFYITTFYQRLSLLRMGMVRMIAMEKRVSPQSRDMSRVLWDTFTGSAPYWEIFLRCFHPRFVYRLVTSTLYSLPRYLRGRMKNLQEKKGQVA